MEDKDLLLFLKQQCHDFAFYSFGYQYIFDKRSERYGRWINLLKVFGILVPALIGATASGYGLKNEFLKDLIWVSIPVSIVQFAFSVLAIIYKWDDELSYAYEASQAHNSIYNKYLNLVRLNYDLEDFKHEFGLVHVESNARSQQDSKHGIRDWELRMGMRYSLRDHKKECVSCNIKPFDMLSTDCPVCGRFSFKYKYLNFLL